MLNITKTLKYIYPSIDISKIITTSYTDGTFEIEKWDYEQPRPTNEQILSAWEQCKNIPDPEPPLSEIEQLKKQQADLTFTLMMAGVI
jgi:hypothetical protein